MVPDQTAYLVGLSDRDEADYLCALLNSLPVRGHYGLRGYKHVSMKFVQELALPTYDPDMVCHRELAALSQRAHAATAQGEEQEVSDIEAQIDRLAAQLWGLTRQELGDIQKSLLEL